MFKSCWSPAWSGRRVARARGVPRLFWPLRGGSPRSFFQLPKPPYQRFLLLCKDPRFLMPNLQLPCMPSPVSKSLAPACVLLPGSGPSLCVKIPRPFLFPGKQLTSWLLRCFDAYFPCFGSRNPETRTSAARRRASVSAIPGLSEQEVFPFFARYACSNFLLFVVDNLWKSI